MVFDFELAKGVNCVRFMQLCAKSPYLPEQIGTFHNGINGTRYSIITG